MSIDSSKSYTSKLEALAKYKEPSDEDIDIVDDLSFSRFSKISSSSDSAKDEDSPFFNSKLKHLHPGKLNKIMYPIKELLVDETDENTPFPPDILNIPKRKSAPLQPPVPPTYIESTPPKRQGRTASVKVSLTPAQRVEKRPGIRLKNALENFKFEEMIGRGAFATVYKGINLKTNHVVAIKQILLDKDQDVQALMGEIDLLKILKHPNIVKYHGFVKTSTSLNVFLEYCAGGSLRQLYKRLNSGLPDHQIVSYTRLILNGLNYLHDQGVVHRDVKAANVLITESGDIKLADFGVATKVSSQHQSVVGTPNWMAPETVLGGEGLCTASDIWSLGATIIELFTMNPPYHDLNPMATLHAIGTDDHPPLPKNISSVARDFLMECFQKQPNLRVSAKVLLKHKWLDEEKRREDRVISRISSTKLPDNEIVDVKLTSLSKSDMLNKFSESNHDTVIDTELPDNLVIAGNHHSNDEDDDPFLDIEIDGFNTNELEIQSKMEFLITKFTNRVDVCRNGNDEIAHSLIKILGKISHLVKKYPALHDVLIRDHGILSIFELLENIDDMPDTPKLWFYCLSTLNHIFDRNINQFENFCLLGGIPVVTQFRSNNFDNAIKNQVCKFIRLFLRSDRALSMFISCGGLRVLSKLAEEDFENNPNYPLTSIDCLHAVLTKNLHSSKSDLCRKLSHYGVIFWYIVLLSRLVKRPDSQTYINKIIDILKFFGQSETKVRTNISSPDLFKLLYKIYPLLEDNQKLTILKFVKSMSCVLDILKHLQLSEILEFMVPLVKQYVPGTPHYKEYVNIICPIIFNYCYLNHVRETDLVKLGALPYFKELSKINLPFRQFVLPIMCELVHCEKYVRNSLMRHHILDVYLNLLLDPYWQANALDAILNWYKLDPKHLALESSTALTCLKTGFSLKKVSNIESALESYLKVVTTNSNIRRYLATDETVSIILSKLGANMKNSVVQLTLLRILRAIMNDTTDFSTHMLSTTKSTLFVLESRKNSLLVDELASDIITIID